jgi:elongation factor G
MAKGQVAAAGREAAGPGTGRQLAVAIVGPFQSGKTSLLEALLSRAGAIQRAGSVANGSATGDPSAEARAHRMSVEPNIATLDYLGDTYTFIDLPGSVEFAADLRAVLPACDAAVVVCEADRRKAPALQVILHELEDLNIPRFLFLNKIDQATARVRETLGILQPASRTPLLLRQIPIWKDGVATGFVDLASERAYVYRDQAESARIPLPADETAREKEARYSMLERLADHDDQLMEALIDEKEPEPGQVYADLSAELRSGQMTPVLIGAATRGNGVTRLLKALRHETGSVAETRARLGLDDRGPALAQSLRTIHTAHGGKLSFARVLRGSFRDGETVALSGGTEERIAGLSRLAGAHVTKQAEAAEGACLAFGRLESARTGMAIGPARTAPAPAFAVAAPPPVMAMSIHAAERKDEVKLSAALHRLAEEDIALGVEHQAEGGQVTLMGQGEMHLRVTLERLASRAQIRIAEGSLAIGYRETIRGAASARGRHRKQSGGHGQYGDCVLSVAPAPRGAGIAFADAVTGGAIPRQYIQSVEDGARAALAAGPLGFPVVDVTVTVSDGSHHSVDSSDMAFQTAARLAINEAMPQARPVLLEPVLAVEIAVPTDAMARATQLVTQRRGQILGFGPREGWAGWDVVSAEVPEGEMGGLIVELRSATAGVGSFTRRFDHLAELSGKAAEAVVQQRRRQAA